MMIVIITVLIILVSITSWFSFYYFRVGYKRSRQKLVEKRKVFLQEWRENNKKITEDWMREYESYREKLIEEGKDTTKIDSIAEQVKAMDSKWEQQYQKELSEVDTWL